VLSREFFPQLARPSFDSERDAPAARIMTWKPPDGTNRFLGRGMLQFGTSLRAMPVICAIRHEGR
jgi:hypothetical protein